jgi:hypothetical protein
MRSTYAPAIIQRCCWVRESPCRFVGRLLIADVRVKDVGRKFLALAARGAGGHAGLTSFHDRPRDASAQHGAVRLGRRFVTARDGLCKRGTVAQHNLPGLLGGPGDEFVVDHEYVP